MTRTCIIKGCKSGYRSNLEKVSFFNDPKDPVLAAKWRQVCKIEKQQANNQSVCEHHFHQSEIVRKHVFVDQKTGKVIQEVSIFVIQR